MARAICSLDAVARWAVTGTPIQNKLADLATLLKFLHVYPYSQKRAFEDDISNVWKSDGSEEAVRRLQRLAGCLLLRRPKATIDLPPREDSHLLVELDPPERQLYDEIRMQTVNQIEQAIQMRESFGKMSNYTNVLQRIEALRMVCNLGLYYHSRKRILDSYQPQTDSHTVTWEEMAQRTFDMCRGMDAIQCRVCTYPVDARDPDIENVGAAESLFSRCWEFTCSFCAGSVPNIRGCSSHTPSCPVATVSTREAGLGELSNSASARVWEVAAASPALPTKVSMLVQDLRAQHPDTKW